ncbi:MAG: ABC transporter permease [Deltaproteobacteria bacterium]|nr:ABC transporter permease [Deltaproteobacteria bacterium]
MDTLKRLGRTLLERARVLFEFWKIIFHTAESVIFRFNLGRKATLDVLLKQVYFTAFEALPIISWIALIIGLIIVTQSLSILPRLGGEGLIGEILVWVLVRELGPVFASVIVIARSGTAMASELGLMKSSNEVSALEVMGIDPMHYLVAPRVLGAMISVFVLTFYFEAISIFGGYILAGFGKNIAFSVFVDSIMQAMGFIEISVSLLKSLLFGLIIGTVSSYYGLRVKKSITEIPQATTKAVIGSLRLVFVADAVITILFFI